MLVLDLMRFLSLRLKPKAAAMPRMGRGPGTDADDEVCVEPLVANVAVANVQLVSLLRPEGFAVLPSENASITDPPRYAERKKGPISPTKIIISQNGRDPDRRSK